MPRPNDTIDAPVIDIPYPITDDHVTCMHERSWASLPGLLSRSEAHALRDRMLAQQPRDVIDGLSAKKPDPTTFVQHEGVAWKDPHVMSIATSPRLTSAVLGLMRRPEAIFVHDLSFFKPAGAKRTSYHQDYSHWPFDRWGNLSLWIALDDMTDEMGPLRYLAGSHLQGPLGFINSDVDIRDVNPQLRQLDVVGGRAMMAGDAQAHWGLTIHGAAPNDGPRRREAMAFRYHRSDVRYNGLPHPHYDTFDLQAGQPLIASGKFPLVAAAGSAND